MALPHSRFVIAIDGPSGTGKSTVSRAVATRLHAGYLDTGAMYRIVTLAVLRSRVDPADDDAVATVLPDIRFESPVTPELQRHVLAGVDVTGEIRGDEVTLAVTPVSANPRVRAWLLDRQRSLAHSGRMVVEGRDIGTVIAPDADLKIFLTADAAERAFRRHRQNTETHSPAAGQSSMVDVATVAADLARRDSHDSARLHAPLLAAPDAVVVDSSGLPVEETVARILALAADRGYPVSWSHLGGEHDPVPAHAGPKGTDRGRRIGIIVRHLLYRNRIRGMDRIPPTGGVVIVANHTNFMDGAVLFGSLPRRVSFLIKAEAVKGPLGWLLTNVGQYAIRRDTPDREPLLNALAQLKAGGVIGVFPEGTRGAGTVQNVFNGAGWLAARAGASVVPVAIRGTARPGGRGRRFRPFVDVLVGEPFSVPPGVGRTAVNAATDQIRDKLAALVAVLDSELAGTIERQTQQ